MKTKCSFILKASISVILALLMLFGTVATSIAAVVDVADTGRDADIADTGATTVYFYNTLGWTNVYAYSPEGWDDKGVKNSGTVYNGTQVSNKLWSFSMTNTNGNHVAFSRDSEPNYDNLHNTEACYRDDLAANRIFVPKTTSNGTWNNTVYHSSGSWVSYEYWVIGHQFDNDWNTNAKNCKMTLITTGDNPVFYYTKSAISSDSNFYRFHNGSKEYGPTADTVIGAEGTDHKKDVSDITSSGNNKKAYSCPIDDGAGLTVYFDPVDMKTWVDDTPTRYYIFGEDNSWSRANNYQLLSVGNNTYEATVTMTNEKQFKVWKNDNTYLGANANLDTYWVNSYGEIDLNNTTGKNLQWKLPTGSYKLSFNSSTNKLSVVSEYSVWGGSEQQLGSTSLNSTLTYNAASGLYDGTYTFTSTSWHSIQISASASACVNQWTSSSEVKWSLDTYNNAQVYSGAGKQTMSSDDVMNWIEVTNYSTDYGIKLAAKAEGTTVNLSYDATNKILKIWGGRGSDEALIYAKDGCINIRNNAQQGTSRVIGTTAVTASTNVTDISRQSLGNEECYTYAKAKKGEEITVTTTVNSTYGTKYLVKGWDVNGTTYGLDPVASGTAYSATFTVPDADKVEITPIYWLKNGSVTTFFVKDFNKVPSGWGSALYYYYWGGSQVNVDAEEVYPGQPFVHEGGQYYAQVPKDVTGVTLNNAVWDTIHGQEIMGVGNQQSANHWQTYDYDNFAKIAKEKTDINSVYFTFKYESVKDNLGSDTAPNSSITLSDYGENGNGWEDYKNPLGEDINIFGEKITSAGSTTLYVVSNGYARNYQGDYATEWSIYSSADNTSGTFVGTIPSSALVLDSSSDFATYGDSGYGPDITFYQTVWNTLKSYSNAKVKISYEKGMDGGLSLINKDEKTKGGGDDQATRIDGKWDYVLNSDYSTANIIIQKSTNNGASYTTDEFSSGNTGTTTQATAFFNNAGTSYVNKHVVTTDDHVVASTTNKYKLKTVPQPSTGYQFVGWYRLDDGSETPELISKSTEAESLMSAKATFIARYKHVTSGNLIISHLADGEGDSTNHTLKVEIYAEDATPGTDDPITSFTGNSVSLGERYISSASNYKIRVTLTAIADASSYIANSNAEPTVACSQNGYYANPSYSRTGRFDGSVYPQNVVTTLGTFTIASLFNGENQKFTVLNYTTTFNKLPTYTIYYKYHGRQSTGESDYLTFTRTISLTPDEAEGKDKNGAKYTGNDGVALTATYITEGTELVNDITANAPNNNDLLTQVFNKNIAWSVPQAVPANSVTVFAAESDPTYKLTYSYVNENGILVPGQEVEAAYDTRIDFGTKISGKDTYVTADTYNGKKFKYWALGSENGDPLTSTREYKMRLVNDVTIYPVYGNGTSGWTAAIDKITRTHETSDTSDSVFTDFALRFTGFDTNGTFMHINPDYSARFKVGVAVVYNTEGNNTTYTTVESNSTLNPFPNFGNYTNATEMVQLLVNKNIATARLSNISSTTYVSKYDADNNKLTNFNRIDYALKYNYNTYYKRSYDAYAYVIDTTNKTGGVNGTVIAVSPVKSGYIYDGKLPSGAGN